MGARKTRLICSTSEAGLREKFPQIEDTRKPQRYPRGILSKTLQPTDQFPITDRDKIGSNSVIYSQQSCHSQDVFMHHNMQIYHLVPYLIVANLRFAKSEEETKTRKKQRPRFSTTAKESE